MGSKHSRPQTPIKKSQLPKNIVQLQEQRNEIQKAIDTTTKSQTQIPTSLERNSKIERLESMIQKMKEIIRSLEEIKETNPTAEFMILTEQQYLKRTKAALNKERAKRSRHDGWRLPMRARGQHVRPSGHQARGVRGALPRDARREEGRTHARRVQQPRKY